MQAASFEEEPSCASYISTLENILSLSLSLSLFLSLPSFITLIFVRWIEIMSCHDVMTAE